MPNGGFNIYAILFETKVLMLEMREIIKIQSGREKGIEG
jgi:hypothetical protein